MGVALDEETFEVMLEDTEESSEESESSLLLESGLEGFLGFLVTVLGLGDFLIGLELVFLGVMQTLSLSLSLSLSASLEELSSEEESDGSSSLSLCVILILDEDFFLGCDVEEDIEVGLLMEDLDCSLGSVLIFTKGVSLECRSEDFSTFISMFPISEDAARAPPPDLPYCWCEVNGSVCAYGGYEELCDMLEDKCPV